MLMNTVGYDPKMMDTAGIGNLRAEEITELLEKYLGQYKDCFLNRSQEKYFRVFQRGLLSDLDRKTIEPIALSFMTEKDVRGLQQYFRRSTLPDAKLLEQYQANLAESITSEDGFLSVDGSDFAKKGSHSAGVARQHCGRLGKTENCQAGVFVSYASEKGYGLVDGRLYLPKAWLSEEYLEKRRKCEIPDSVHFQTKNEMAAEMIRQTVQDGKFPVKWVGCDAAFGCDHAFLQSLPDSVRYFAAIRENELVFMTRPEMRVPETPHAKGGRPFRHPRPSVEPIPVRAIALDPLIPWERRSLGEGAKGPILSEIKCIRCVFCDGSVEHGDYMNPGPDIWVYIRKHEDGTLKYFISNASADTPTSILDRLATMRWSIEQCFQECKSYLGMTHYESRTYAGWHRHMLMVMIAHLFTLQLRLQFKKTLSYHADG